MTRVGEPSIGDHVARPLAWPDRPHYGGYSLIALAAAVLLNPLLAKIVDNARLHTDQYGTTTVVYSGNVGGLIGVLLMCAAAACSVLALVSGRERMASVSIFSLIMAVLIVWWAFTSTLLQGNPFEAPAMLSAVCAILIVLGVMVDPPDLRVVRSLNGLRDLTAVLLLAYAFLFPAQGQLPCREDKCGIFGSLFISFAPHENAAAAMVAMSSPVVLAASSRTRMYTSTALGVLLVTATGSRTALLTVVVSAGFVILAGRDLRRADVRGPVSPLKALPLLLFGLSTAVFVFAGPTALTGRGLIYWAVRQQLHGRALILGSGPDTMSNIATVLGGFAVTGEHGQAPHVIILAGLVGWILFATALLAIVWVPRWDRRHYLALGLAVVAGIQGLDEAAWNLEVRTPGFVAAVLAIGLLCDRGTTGYMPVRARTADRRRFSAT